jgi:hypothetical protein
MKTSTLLNEKNINATLVAFCIVLASFMWWSSRVYNQHQEKQAKLENVINTNK